MSSPSRSACACITDTPPVTPFHAHIIQYSVIRSPFRIWKSETECYGKGCIMSSLLFWQYSCNFQRNYIPASKCVSRYCIIAQYNLRITDSNHHCDSNRGYSRCGHIWIRRFRKGANRTLRNTEQEHMCTLWKLPHLSNACGTSVCRDYLHCDICDHKIRTIRC